MKFAIISTALLITTLSGVEGAYLGHFTTAGDSATHGELGVKTSHDEMRVKASHDEVRVTVQATDILVYVNCTFTRGKTSNMATFESLSISDYVNSSKVWAHIDVSSDTPTALGGYVSGNIHESVGGFLSVTWPQPILLTKLVFHCTAVGRTSTGETVVVDDIDIFKADPVFTPVNMSSCERSQANLQTQLSLCKHQVTAQKAFIEDFKSTCPVPAPCRPSPLTLPDGFTHQSGQFNHHRYLLTEPMLTDIVKAKQLCHKNHAYLAEIQDQKEFTHVTQFLNGSLVKEQIYIGMNLTKGTWKYSSSGEDVSFFHWNTASHQPYTLEGRNCVILIPDDNLEMSCTVCQQPEDDYKRRYLCEHPVPAGDC